MLSGKIKYELKHIIQFAGIKPFSDEWNDYVFIFSPIDFFCF